MSADPAEGRTESAENGLHCPYCGKPIEDTTLRFCAYCGKDIKDDLPVPVNGNGAAQAETSEKKKRVFLIPVIIGSVLLLSLLVAGLFFIIKNRPGNTGEPVLIDSTDGSFTPSLTVSPEDPVNTENLNTDFAVATAGISTGQPASNDTQRPAETPTQRPTAKTTQRPTATPTQRPAATPTQRPTVTPTQRPTATPTRRPTSTPTQRPTATPTQRPTAKPTQRPTATPTQRPTATPAPTEIVLTEIFLSQAPAKKTYYAGDELDLTGMVLSARYSDGSSERINSSSISVPDMNTPGEKKVYFALGGKRTYYEITVKDWSVQLYVDDSAMSTRSAMKLSATYPCGELSWESGNRSVAEISSDGTAVFSKKTGTVVLKALVKNNNVTRTASKTVNIAHSGGTVFATDIESKTETILYGSRPAGYIADIPSDGSIPAYVTTTSGFHNETKATATGMESVSYRKDGTAGYIYYQFSYSQHNSGRENNQLIVINYQEGYRNVMTSGRFKFSKNFSYQFYSTVNYPEHAGNTNGRTNTKYYARYWAYQDTQAGHPWYVCEGRTGAWAASYYRFPLTRYVKETKIHTDYTYTIS